MQFKRWIFVFIGLFVLAVPTTAVIQTTLSPLPTATVTPTATPIVYTIVEGDTLLGIAIDNLPAGAGLRSIVVWGFLSRKRPSF